MNADMNGSAQLSFLEIENPVEWAVPTPEMVRGINAAPWKVVDVETTGLTPGSAPLVLSAREIREGADAKLRLRVLTVGWMDQGQRRIEAFDLDYVNALAKRGDCPPVKELVGATLANTFIAHNAGFDLYWCRDLNRKVMPTTVIDTMLLGRVLRPDVPLLLQQMAAEVDDVRGTGDEFDRAARDAIIGGHSGWSLADMMLALFRRKLPKELQGPRNWTVSRLDMDEARYAYATSDVIQTWDLIEHLFGDTGQDLLERYAELKATKPVIARVEPQVPELIRMREKGMAANTDHARSYAKAKHAEAVVFSRELVALDSELTPFEAAFANPNKGLSADAKRALSGAFQRRGVILRVTEKTGEPMIGEKDLRLAKAPVIPEAKPLFTAWVGLSKAKKVANMALEFAACAERSADKRIHALIGHGPVTGRLSSQDVNTQQAPRDQGFRNINEAPEGKNILSADYGALDMRAGAALAIRAQQQILAAYAGNSPKTVDAELAKAIAFAMTHTYPKVAPAAKAKLATLAGELDVLSAQKEAGNIVHKSYWDQRRKLSKQIMLGKFTLRLMECRHKAEQAGESTYSALRDAFRLGVDIHTFTALGMLGIDAKAEFQGLAPEALLAKQDDWKHKLKKHPEGDKRQHGKVANLSLLYAMKAAGLVDTAGKVYGVYWTLQESESILAKWLDTYPEIDLWHLWTELTPEGSMWGVNPDTGRRTKLNIYRSVTLDNREIMAFSINAALSYEDQSTGADILGRVMHATFVDYPEMFDCIYNQVHDEVLLEFNEETAEADTKQFVAIMNEQAEELLMPYGVPSSVGPALGKVWIKD